jgi:hypothetical protein
MKPLVAAVGIVVVILEIVSLDELRGPILISLAVEETPLSRLVFFFLTSFFGESASYPRLSAVQVISGSQLPCEFQIVSRRKIP